MSADISPTTLTTPPTEERSAADIRREEKRYALSQWQLMWRKYKRSRMGVAGGVMVILFYVMAVLAHFLAPYAGDQRFIEYLYAPPERLHWERETGLYVYALETTFDKETLKSVYVPDSSKKVPLDFFVEGEPYTILGIIKSSIHLYGAADPKYPVFLLGSDRQGRDMLSRCIIGSQMSLSIGLLGVFMSLIIGSVLGVSSGYYGGAVDNFMQRMIEVIRSFPTIPLWMALGASLPQHWPPEKVYFSITIILSFIGWTWLARQLRGKVLSLREEDFVLAAQLAGASDRRVIFRHLIPSVLGHIIVIATLAMPGMILAESALSFLNLGLRPPLISWGVLLQEAQSLESLRQYPWLLVPAAFIAACVLSFNFFGDGLRDASDPYTQQ
jgi:peptide/nickel transport system permease protein